MTKIPLETINRQAVVDWLEGGLESLTDRQNEQARKGDSKAVSYLQTVESVYIYIQGQIAQLDF